MIRGIVGGKRRHGQQQRQQGGALWWAEAVDILDSFLDFVGAPDLCLRPCSMYLFYLMRREGGPDPALHRAGARCARPC